MRSDFCSIDLGSVGTNEGTFTPRNFLNVGSWSDGADSSVSDATVYKFYGYYPETGSKEATYSSSLGGVLLNVPAAQTGEFGRYQICSSGEVALSKSEILKNKMVRFTFAPLTSLLRVRFKFTATDQDGAPIDYLSEVYIKQLILTMTDGQEPAGATVPADATLLPLAGDCQLNFADNTLTRSQSGTSEKRLVVNLTNPVKVTKEYEGSGYVDIVLLPGTESGRLYFQAGLQNGRGEFTVASKDAPAGGFQPGVRYFLDREISIKIAEDSMPDGSYVDGGSMWDSKVENDGAYTDGGNIW